MKSQKYQKIALTTEQIGALLAPFGAKPSNDQISKIVEYADILLKWNKLLSLTTVVDASEIITRHFGESMYLTELLPVENCRLADVGTGAGFPGLALKIVRPELRVRLIESNRKKSAFLFEVIRTLGLTDVEVINSAFEELRPEQYMSDIVTARAVGNLSNLLSWAKLALSSRGHTALWVGGEDAIKLAQTQGWVWRPAVRIPESQRRFILIGAPASVNQL